MCAVVVGTLGVGVTGASVNVAGAASGSSAAVKHTVATPVSTANFTFSVSLSGLTKSAITLTGSGQADFQNDAVAVAVNVPAAVAKLFPGGSDSPEVVNVVLSGGTVYLEIPGLATVVGEPWISVALPAAATSAIPGLFTKAASALGDVDAIVQFAQAHHATVTSLGSATVDGVQADGTQITARLPGRKAAPMLTASVWADGSDRLVQANASVTGGLKKKALDLTATVDLSGYGDPVTITVPPASQVRAIPYATVAKFLGKFLHHARRG